MNSLYFFLALRDLEISRLLFSVSASCTLIVSIIFWTFLASSIQTASLSERVAMIVQHLLNSVIVFSECYLSPIKIKWYDFIFVDLFILIYGAIIILLRVTLSIEWPYPFFEYLDHLISGFLSLIAAMLLGITGFLLFKGLLHIKRIAKQKFEEEEQLIETNEG